MAATFDMGDAAASASSSSSSATSAAGSRTACTRAASARTAACSTAGSACSTASSTCSTTGTAASALCECSADRSSSQHGCHEDRQNCFTHGVLLEVSTSDQSGVAMSVPMVRRQARSDRSAMRKPKAFAVQSSDSLMPGIATSLKRASSSHTACAAGVEPGVKSIGEPYISGACVMANGRVPWCAVMKDLPAISTRSRAPPAPGHLVRHGRPIMPHRYHLRWRPYV